MFVGLLLYNCKIGFDSIDIGKHSMLLTKCPNSNSFADSVVIKYTMY